jgi:hypothetical protein
MPTLLFQNVLPTPPLDDPTYLEGIANLGAAVQAGAGRLYLIRLIGGPAARLLVARAQQPAAPAG